MSVFAVLRWFNFNLPEWPSDVNPEASEWFFLLSLMWQQGAKALGGLHHSYSVLVPSQDGGALQRIPA